MNKIETLDFLVTNKLKHYNFFNDHEDVPNEVAIDTIRNTWLIVYETDDANNRINVSEYANHEEAYDDFLTRVKEINDMNTTTSKIYRLMIAHYKGVDYVAQFQDKPIIRLYTVDQSLLDLGFKKEEDAYSLDIPIDQCEYIKLFSIDVYDKKNRYCGEAESVKGDLLYAINDNLKSATSKELQELGMLGEEIHKQDSRLVYRIRVIQGDEEGDFSTYTPTCDLCENEATHISSWGVLVCDDCYVHICDEHTEISQLSYEQRLLKAIGSLNALDSIFEKYIHIPAIDHLHFVRHVLLQTIRNCLNTGNELEEIPDVVRYHWCNMNLTFHDLLINNFYTHALSNQVILDIQTHFSTIDNSFSIFPERKVAIHLSLEETMIYETEANVEEHISKLFHTLIEKTKDSIDCNTIYSFSIVRRNREEDFEFLSYLIKEDKIISNYITEQVREIMYFDTNISVLLFNTPQERAKYLWLNNPESKEYGELSVTPEMLEAWQKEQLLIQTKKERAAKRSKLLKISPYIFLAIMAICSIIYIKATDNKSSTFDDDDTVNVFDNRNPENEKRTFAMQIYSLYSVTNGTNGKKQLLDLTNNTVLLEADDIDFQYSYLQFYRVGEYWYMYNLDTKSTIADPSLETKITDYFPLSTFGDDGLYIEYYAVSLNNIEYQIYNSTGTPVDGDILTKEDIYAHQFEDGKMVK